MRLNEQISNNPIGVEKSVRGDEIRALTSCRAGSIVPISYIPLLREDRISRGMVNVQLEMKETLHPLMNAINVTAFAHFVPFLAFDRFKSNGMDSYNRSYQGEGEPHNDLPIPYFTHHDFSRDDPFYKTMGIHWRDGEPINAAVKEAYQTIVNFRRTSRSRHLPLYDNTSSSAALASAFWKNSNMWHVVPDFDQAAMDGEVELQFADSRLPVSGIGRTAVGGIIANRNVTESPELGGAKQYPHSVMAAFEAHAFRTDDRGVPDVFAELAQSGIKVSLANIELAKQTAAFAKLREQYAGKTDEHIIDLLMEGIRVPDEQLKQPILLDRKSTVFGYSERHATDGENLDKSVTTGQTAITLNFRTPPMNVQGVVVITLEIVPEQLFERMYDTFLGLETAATLPNFMRDYLDPEKVDIVANKYVDVSHDTPEATFGYAPLNHAWKRSLTRVGGKYLRPEVDSFIEDRQRFWSVETPNPTLTEDFYLVRDLPHTVFADMLADPFEILTLGNVQIVGNTVFGKTLVEDDGHYDKILEQVDQERINQNPQ